MQVVLCKSILLTDLSGSQYLFEILQTLLTVKNSENGVKSGCFKKKVCHGERQFISQIKERYKVSCVKILIFCEITRRLVICNIAHPIHCQN